MIPFFLLLKELLNNRIALVASLFYIISPRIVEYSTEVLREPVFWFFSMLSLYLAWKGITSRKYLFILLASLFTGLASFTRFEGAALVLIILLWVIWCYLDRKINAKNLIAMIFVFLVSFPLIISPFVFALKNTLGKWELGLIGEKLPRLVLTHDVDQDLELKPEMANITSNRFKTFYDMAVRQKYAVYFSEAIYKFAKSLHLIFFILFLFGVIGRKYIPYSRKEVPLIIWLAVFFLSIYIYMAKTCYLSTRHGLLMSIPALAWSSIGFYELKEKGVQFIKKRTNISKFFAKYDSAIMFLLIFSIVLPNAVTPSGRDKVELKKAGIYLKEHGYSKVRFAGEHSLYRVAFYTDADFVTIPVMSDYKSFEQFITENNAEYIMFDDRTINSYMPALKGNLDPSRFIKVSLPQLEEFKEYSIMIYRINGG